jgi:hypothetical protein
LIFNAGGGRAMTETQHEPTLSMLLSEDRERSTTQFLKAVEQHVAAIQEAGHQRLARPTEDGSPALQGIELTIQIGPQGRHADGRMQAEREFFGYVCKTVTIPCGKSANGYIYCTVSYCEITDPVTVLP